MLPSESLGGGVLAGGPLNRSHGSITARNSSSMADSFDPKMDDISIACGKRSRVRRCRFLSIERGEIGRERQPTCLGARIEKCLPARRDKMSRGAPDLKRLTTGACLWQAGQEHLEPEHEHARGETSSCVLRDSRACPAPGALQRITQIT